MDSSAKSPYAKHLQSMISPTGNTRHRYKKWFHAVEKQPFQDHTITVVTWHFVHHSKSHAIVLCDDTYSMSRSLICDEKDTWSGNPDMGYWQFEWTMGSVADPIECCIEMVPTLTEGYKYHLAINSISFESARDVWMNQQAAREQHQLQQRDIDRVIQPRPTSASSSPTISTSASTSTSNPPFATDPLSYRQWIETHWGRWTDYEKTKYGGHKTKVTWKFTIKAAVHQLVLHHSWMSGKRKLFLDTQGEPVMANKPSILDRNKPFHHVVTIDGVDVTVLITRQIQKSAREHSCPYVYDLLIDSVPFDACTSIPSPVNAVGLIKPKHHKIKRAHSVTNDHSQQTQTQTQRMPTMTRPHTTSNANTSIATTAPASTATSAAPSRRGSPNSSSRPARHSMEDWPAQFPSFDLAANSRPSPNPSPSPSPSPSRSPSHSPSPPLKHVSGQNGTMIPVANVLGVDERNPFDSDRNDTGNPFLDSPSTRDVTLPSASVAGSAAPSTIPVWTATFD